ncbi:MAG TPA: hypothetical protein VNY36_06265 [Bacteroidia bacterium]|jgi:hypothetical protein|nr:hypothetical protein [Bacteroidia bacterium]
MQTNVQNTQPDKSSNMFLTGAILFANLDFASLEEYAIKAAIGGMIWMVFKLAGEYFTEKIKKQ